MSFKIMILINFLICLLITFIPEVNANQDEKRLYEDLFSTYNLLIRPVESPTDFITVKLSFKLIKIIELVCIAEYAFNCFIFTFKVFFLMQIFVF